MKGSIHVQSSARKEPEYIDLQLTATGYQVVLTSQYGHSTIDKSSYVTNTFNYADLSRIIFLCDRLNGEHKSRQTLYEDHSLVGTRPSTRVECDHWVEFT